MKITESYNVQIWVGLRAGYSARIHPLDDVRNICDRFVNSVKDCVTITPTEFRYVDGMEPGVIVGYINYPRFPRKPEEIEDRAIQLAEELMVGLEQNSVTVTTPTQTYMLSNENPYES